MSKRHIFTAALFVAFSTSSFSESLDGPKKGEEFKGLMFNNDAPGGHECEHKTFPIGTVVKITREKPNTEKKVVTEKIAKPLPGGNLESNFGRRKGNQHEGVDLTGGKKVVAALDGKVSKAGWGRGFGKLVLLDHKNEEGKVFKTTLYGHLRRYKVKPGQNVKKGQTIGIMGSTGRSSGPHLHFEIANNKRGGYDAHVLSRKENPVPYLKGKDIGKKVVGGPKGTTCTITGRTHFSEDTVSVTDSVAEEVGLEKTGLIKVAFEVMSVPPRG